MASQASSSFPRSSPSGRDNNCTLAHRSKITGEDVVRDFLHSLVQPQDELLLLFVEAGIQDEASLRGFAALPEAEQLKLLRSDLHLNILQSRIILHGLAQLVSY